MTECTQSSFEFEGHFRARWWLASMAAPSPPMGALLLGEVEQTHGSCGNWPPASPTIAIPTSLNTPSPNSSPSVSTASPWDTKTSTITTPCVSIRFWPRLSARPTPPAPLGCVLDRGKALAGKSTLNRLELTPADASARERYKKIVAPGPRPSTVYWWTCFCKPTRSRPHPSSWIWTPRMIPCTAIRKAASFTATTRNSATCRCTSFVAIICCVRACGRPIATPRRERGGTGTHRHGDPGCLAGGAYPLACRLGFLSGAAHELVRDPWHRLPVRPGPQQPPGRNVGRELQQAQQQFERPGRRRASSPSFYRTQNSWSRARRVVGKAEYLPKGANPRFVVTSLRGAAGGAGVVRG